MMNELTGDPEDDLPEDPRLEFQASIAEGLAALSEEQDESPNGVVAALASFAADDVDFASGDWIARLVEVQGWLNFPDELPTKSREDFLYALSDFLSIDSREGLEVAADSVELSAVALERLNLRIDTALRLQQVFLEDLDTKGRESATEAWADSWAEEDVGDDLQSPAPVTAKADVWPIFQLTKRKLNLTPSYQRGDVWGASERQALIESILRGIPLPSIILLRGGSSTPHEVVDGKQRLTTILRFVGAHPLALERVREADRLHPGKNLETLFTSDYPRFRVAWKAVMHESLNATLENEYYFPFKLRKSEAAQGSDYLAPLQGKYYTQIKSEKIKVSDQELEVQELFEGAPDYKIPVIEYTSATQQQIHEVFRLYNKQGVHLNAEEIRNAVYHEVDLARAILVAAGDADPRSDVRTIAPALADIPDLHRLGESLRGYRFGDARYKRTKLLSWVISVLVRPADKSPLSTARHIDQLLKEIEQDRKHPLRTAGNLRALFELLGQAVDLHASLPELWHESFMDGGKGAKWQELQLVGSLVGMAFAVAALPGDIDGKAEEHARDMREASRAWKRPSKTQTKTQWTYIAEVAAGVLSVLNIDCATASARIQEIAGASGLEALQSMNSPA